MYIFGGLFEDIEIEKPQQENTNPKLSSLFGIPQFIMWIKFLLISAARLFPTPFFTLSLIQLPLLWLIYFGLFMTFWGLFEDLPRTSPERFFVCCWRKQICLIVIPHWSQLNWFSLIWNIMCLSTSNLVA